MGDLLGIYDENGQVIPGTHAALEAIADLTITQLSDGDLLVERINTLKLGDVISIDGDSPLILQSLSEATLENLGETIKTLTLSQIVEIDNNAPEILKALANSTLESLGDDINNLTIDR